jgi:hypothetical protein
MGQRVNQIYISSVSSLYERRILNGCSTIGYPMGLYRVMGETRNAYRIFVGKPEGKTPLGRPRRRWVDNIKIYCDVPPERRDIGARIQDCSRAKHVSPTTNQAIAQQ